jgi:hypothetical protein
MSRPRDSVLGWFADEENRRFSIPDFRSAMSFCPLRSEIGNPRFPGRVEGSQPETAQERENKKEAQYT